MAANWSEAQQRWIDACCRQLVAQGVAEPLSTEEQETRDWSLCQLASLVEGHLHEQIDVTRLSADEFLGYERRVSYDGRPLESPHGRYSHPFWLLAGRRPAPLFHVPFFVSKSLPALLSTFPVQRETLLVEQKASPVQRKGSPVEPKGSLVQRGTLLAEQKASLVQRKGSPVEQKGSLV